MNAGVSKGSIAHAGGYKLSEKATGQIIRMQTTKKRTPCRNTASVLSSPRD